MPGVLIFEPQEDGGVFLLQFGRFFREVRLAFGEEVRSHGRPLAITGGDGALVLECFYAGPNLPLLDGTGAPATDDGLTITAETAGESQTTLFSTLYQLGPTGRRGQSPLPGQLAVVFLYQRAGGAAELDRGLPHGLV